MKGTLYVIGTPIGNMGDISTRAKDVLTSVDVIVCEDTRVTGQLLKRLSIEQKQLISYTSHSSEGKHEKIIDILKEGKNVALISDAGTPTISDPGYLIVAKIHEAFKEEAKVVSVPGPSALVSALSISGIPASEFVFLGFLPHKKGRETLFAEITESKRTMVFYESPHRIEKTLDRLAELLPENRLISIAREITKLHEEVIRGTALYCKTYLTENQEKVRGEFVVIVEAK